MIGNIDESNVIHAREWLQKQNQSTTHRSYVHPTRQLAPYDHGRLHRRMQSTLSPQPTPGRLQVGNNIGFDRQRRYSDPLDRVSTPRNNNRNGDANYSFYGGARPLLTTIARPKFREKTTFQFDSSALLGVVHVLVVIVVTAHVVVNSRYEFVIQRDAFYDWNQVLFPPKLAPTDNVDEVVKLVTQEQTLDTVRQIVDLYFNTLKNDSVTHYEYILTEDDRVLPMTLAVSMFDYPPLDSSSPSTTHDTSYEITSPLHIGPLSNLTQTQQNAFFESLNSMWLEFRIKSIIFSFTRLCMEWTVRYRMDGDSRGGLVGTIQTSQTFCPRGEEIGEGSSPSAVFLLDCLLVSFSSLSLLLAWYHALRDEGWCGSDSGFRRLSPKKSKNETKRCATSLRSRRWFISQVTDILNIVGGCLAINERLNFETILSNFTLQFFFAFASMLAWMRLVLFVKYIGPRFYVLVKTLQDATPFLLRFAVGVLPVFVGFACFGVAAFSKITRKFRDLDLSSMSLYAILNGDMIEDTYHDLMFSDRSLGQLYVYAVILLFMWFMSKLALASIEYYFFMNVPAAEVVEYDEMYEHTKHQDTENDDDDDDDADVHGWREGNDISLFHNGTASECVKSGDTALRESLREHQSTFNRHFNRSVRNYFTHHAHAVCPTHDNDQVCDDLESCSVCKCASVFSEYLDKLQQQLDEAVHDSQDFLVRN